MSNQYQVSFFRAEQPQQLRNVRIHSPSIIQIITGSKRLFWKDATEDILPSQVLLCEASASMCFENLPQKGRFLSRMFSFYCQPPNTMLELSTQRASRQEGPALMMDSALHDTLNALFSFDLNTMSQATQTFWVMGLFQQLAEKGALHQLFRNSSVFSRKLSYYLAYAPGKEHALETVAERFAMSRATLIRKLKQEGTQYREVLAEVRLSHALHLMQNGHDNVLSLAQQCGYQSAGRFSQRFKGKFGVTPADYMKTLNRIE
ncbi:helix-turn-helix transcriptional regulator [Vibrio sp. ZSDZ65]|uniref:Helix-turn-helix transcriptional regulator n=1 Tax=Vibrio qingdaonensis TaxID=2829491 RepID=A0A9X3CM87_9VIBR|nr:helix-turn-helix transcriptional regulator [Vibrio qingdaonensis]MCW8345841.1 helix-turn-helix transcriptional regulator [Vibrio qingdaonensis]